MEPPSFQVERDHILSVTVQPPSSRAPIQIPHDEYPFSPPPSPRLQEDGRRGAKADRGARRSIERTKERRRDDARDGVDARVEAHDRAAALPRHALQEHCRYRRAE